MKSKLDCIAFHEADHAVAKLNSFEASYDTYVRIHWLSPWSNESRL